MYPSTARRGGSAGAFTKIMFEREEENRQSSMQIVVHRYAVQWHVSLTIVNFKSCIYLFFLMYGC